MTTEQMQYFIFMAQTLSFTKTAERFYLSQPTLSRQIKRIEDELGVELFIRSGSTVHITKAGERLYSGLKHIYQQYLDLTEAVKAIASQNNCFRIGLAEEQMMDNEILIAINLFRTKHPNVELSIHRATHHDLLFGVADGRYNVAATIQGPSGYERLGIACLKLAEEPAYLVMAKGSTRKVSG
jgi:LysR family transcriptional activator of glutamate synthase operon